MREALRRSRPAVYVVLAASIAAAAIILLDRQRQAPEALVLDFTAPVRREIRVEVVGAVQSPGVFVLHAGDRIEEALGAAGGLLDDADGLRINRASLLVDGQRLRVPAHGDAIPEGLVDLNSAPAALIDTLPGIGPVRAAAIVESRESLGPFMRLEELVERRLLPASVLDQLRPLVATPP